MQESQGAQRKWGARTGDERRTARRAALMHAALRLYGAQGYRATSVKSVCGAAGLTERYFYESFDTSEHLLCECFRAVTRTILHAMREAARESTGSRRARVRAALLVYLQYLQANPAEARVFLLEMASISPATEALVATSLREFGMLLVETLGLNPPLGGAGSLLLQGVIGGGLYIARSWIADGCKEPLERVADTAMQLYLLVERVFPD